jgi:hypothetical protein
MAALLTVCFIAGVALLTYGAWLAWEPAGFLVCGAALILIPLRYASSSWTSSNG